MANSTPKPIFYFIGGAADWAANPMFNAYQSENDSRIDKKFYHWSGDTKEWQRGIPHDRSELLAEILRSHGENRKVALVGHSYGGDTAMDLARMVSAAQDKSFLYVATLDPVSWFTRHPEKHQSIVYWVNVWASGGGTWDPDNLIARVGGRWQSTKAADEDIALSVSHAQATAMYREAREYLVKKVFENVQQ